MLEVQINTTSRVALEEFFQALVRTGAIGSVKDRTGEIYVGQFVAVDETKIQLGRGDNLSDRVWIPRGTIKRINIVSAWDS
jgi:hypothetical protein